MNKLLSDTAIRAARYLATLPERPVTPSREALAAIADFPEALPNDGASPETVVALLDQIGSPASIANAGPRFFGFVTGGATPASLAANWLASAWDQNAAMEAVTPAVARLEELSRRWLLDILGLPPASGAAFVTGATVANFTALAAARHAILARENWNVEAAGLFGAPDVNVIVSKETHPSVFKSLGLLGFGRDRVTAVPTDSLGQMQLDKLVLTDAPTIICAQVGNVNTGGSDPVGEIAKRIAGSNAWLHVDGAFGLWLRASERLGANLNGIEHADSWATDAHKWLNVPYDSGVAFVKDAQALKQAMAISAAYLPLEGSVRNPSDFTPELSRRARGVEIWAAVSELGKTGIGAMVERHCDQARRFADGLAEAGYDILCPVTMNQVLVSFGSTAENRRVIEAIQEEGTCWCGITKWQSQTAMRISVCNHMTSDDDVELSLAAILRVAAAVL